MKLVFDHSSHGAISIRQLDKSVWRKIRKEHLQRCRNHCVACRAKPEKPLEGHEVYSFPGNGVVRVKTVAMLCQKCHHAVHLDRSLWIARLYARARAEAKRPKLRKAEIDKRVAGEEAKHRKRLMRHYYKVNKVTPAQAEREFQTAGAPYRCKEMDYGPYAQALADMARKREALRDVNDYDDDDDDDFDFLPDHEFPEDTAMWRDTFG